RNSERAGAGGRVVIRVWQCCQQARGAQRCQQHAQRPALTRGARRARRARRQGRRLSLAVARGATVRSDQELLRAAMDGATTQSKEDAAAARIQAGVRGYLARKKLQQERDAATKIQAGFRGYKTRQAAQQ
ncbi:abnormal spindle-like microcephaly-associated protein homolog, partial [Bacillus rossius redtenbacheri]|uniref:abnormal spindle-like microcephaly-associated protein homolog n=1 Tax=Bacillus rossius redtenbacheri TaxID=93214 RepID=UPI002FDEE5BF